MKFVLGASSVLMSLAVGGNARFVEAGEGNQAVINIPMLEQPHYLIDFSNGETRRVSVAEKWQLKTDNEFFMDITGYRDLGSHSQSTQEITYPSSVHLKSTITPLLNSLNKTNIQSHLEYFTTFHNRWYRSPYGEASYHWLLSTIITTITDAGAHKYGVTASSFVHPWGQNSIVVTIPGRTNNTIVVGAHQDSVNHADPMEGRAPGADDDGSGTCTILEVLRVVLGSKELLEGKAENTDEFHWYSGEEAGLLGSQAVFEEYAKQERVVKAMLQVDMMGFWNATIEKEKEFGLMMDVGTFDAPLMEYVKLIVKEYTDIPWVKTGCGPTCGSDHMSALKAGYPGVFVIEGEFKLGDKRVHGIDDLTEYLDYDHMIDHAELTLGFMYELAFAKL